MVKKIKVKVGPHLLSPNAGRYIIFGPQVLDGIQAPHARFNLRMKMAPLLVEGPYYAKSNWQKLKELIKR